MNPGDEWRMFWQDWGAGIVIMAFVALVYVLRWLLH